MARLIPIGLLAGFFSALFGVGGGIVMVPLLILAIRFRERAAAATSLAAIAIMAAAGAAAYTVTDRVHLVEAALVGLPAAAGAVMGASLQQRIPRGGLSLLFAGFLVVIAGVLFFA